MCSFILFVFRWFFEKLAASGVRCPFAGAVCYADDIVLLESCASALRILLKICSLYASTHGLSFNP